MIPKALRANTGKDSWQTPEEILSPIYQHEKIDLDPCAGKETNIGSKENFRIESNENGLVKDWDITKDCTVFVNPPFSRKTAFLEKAVDEYQKGNVCKVIFLTPDNTDASESWHSYISKYFRLTWFSEGRVSFINPETGKPVTKPPFNTALHIVGNISTGYKNHPMNTGDLVKREVQW